MDEGDEFKSYECHVKNGCGRVVKDHRSNNHLE